MGQGREKSVQYMKDNPEVYRRIDDATRQLLANNTDTDTEIDEDDEDAVGIDEGGGILPDAAAGEGAAAQDED